MYHLSMMLIALVILVALLAFANGANDNGKGVATLVGYGAARPIQALIFATPATAAGGAVSFFFADGMLKGFSGSWLFEHGVTLDRSFYLAVLIGACGWMLIANKTGMPVSTTHAIIGALCGAGVVAFGKSSLTWSMLWQKFAVPLAISPVLSLGITYAIAWPALWIVGIVAGRCVCVVQERFATVSAGTAANAMANVNQVSVIAATEAACSDEQPIAVARASAATNGIHWLTCGMISFARGRNDTPKMAALVLLAFAGVAHGAAIGVGIVTLAMAAGGLLMGRRVLETLSRKLTPLPLAESLTASFVTATLVGLASWMALPVSTTHVATGSIVGAGLKNDPKAIKWEKLGEIVFSWTITLPVAALIAVAVKLIVR